MADVGEGVLNLDAFAEFGPPGRALLALAQFGEQRFAGVDGYAAPIAAGGAAPLERAGRAGGFREADGLARLEGHGHPGGAGQLPGGEVEGELGLGVAAGGVAHPPRLAEDRQVAIAVADQV